MADTKAAHDPGETLQARIREMKKEVVQAGVALAVTNDDQHLRRIRDLKERIEALEYANGQRDAVQDFIDSFS